MRSASGDGRGKRAGLADRSVSHTQRAGSPTAAPMFSIRECVLNAPGDTLFYTGEYHYGFAFHESFRESALDEGGESG